MFEIVDQRMALVDIIIKRISSFKEPQTYTLLFDAV